ncbi:MAG: DNA-directed RNA polymerase subunit E'' [Nanoarchaeota archaeon]|nr:DNA-directed RNA polymerase subunit E'' [Nanoarchaeota archaeon]
MTKEKVCKNCKLFVEGNICPLCKGNNFTNIYQGKMTILDTNKSFIATQIGITEKGKYAIKIR